MVQMLRWLFVLCITSLVYASNDACSSQSTTGYLSDWVDTRIGSGTAGQIGNTGPLTGVSDTPRSALEQSAHARAHSSAVGDLATHP